MKRSEGPVAELETYPSASRPGKFYTVYLGENECLYCDCPAWRFQKRPAAERTCKHIEMFKRDNNWRGR